MSITVFVRSDDKTRIFIGDSSRFSKLVSELICDLKLNNPIAGREIEESYAWNEMHLEYLTKDDYLYVKSTLLILLDKEIERSGDSESKNQYQELSRIIRLS